MYAKALIPGVNGKNVPLLITTAAEHAVVINQLHARGWSTYAGDITIDPGAQLHIMPDRLALTIDGEAILTDDTDPVSPAGWWEAIDSFQGRVVCVAVTWGAVDLTADDLGHRMVALIDSPDTAQAAVPVVH